jgi:hypothetical protein
LLFVPFLFFFLVLYVAFNLLFPLNTFCVKSMDKIQQSTEIING